MVWSKRNELEQAVQSLETSTNLLVFHSCVPDPSPHRGRNALPLLIEVAWVYFFCGSFSQPREKVSPSVAKFFDHPWFYMWELLTAFCLWTTNSFEKWIKRLWNTRLAAPYSLEKCVIQCLLEGYGLAGHLHEKNDRLACGKGL